MQKQWSVVVAGLVTLGTAATGWGGDGPLSREAADRLLRKVEAVRANGASARPRASRVVLSDVEVNSYLAFEGPAWLPAGVGTPRLVLQPGGRVMARAIVDLDAMRRARGPGGWLDPLTYLSGRLPVTSSGVLSAGGGFARLTIEVVDVSGVTVPTWLLRELVIRFTRSPEYPGGVDLAHPVSLPARIRSISVGQGAVVLVQ